MKSETKLVTLQIDGQEVTVPAGTYILQAAEHAGIEVPNLCYQPLLRPWGSCRLCTVEILGSRGGLIESCATPVRDGMEVSTHSPAVVEARQFILQMYLIDHALDCPTCDKSGECYLQDNTYLHNVNANPYRRPKLAQPYRHLRETIDYKWDRCIICARCTRVCDELIGVTAISVIGRGLEAEIGPSYGVDLRDTACTNCGMCIAVCPVGALTDRHFGHHPWELDTTETTCGFCDVGCTLSIEHNRGLVRRVSHLWERGVNLGYTCERGKWGHEHVQDPRRLRYPMIRESSGHVEVELGEALDVVAEAFRHHQGSTFGALASLDNTNEENYALQQFTRAVMNSNSIDRLMNQGLASVDAAMMKSLGTTASTAGMQEMRTDSSCVLVVGPDIGYHEPVASYWLYWALRYRETRMIVVTPDHQFLCERSDNWIPAPIGVEAAVLNAMSKIIIANGLTAHGVDSSDLKRSLEPLDIAAVAASAGVSLDFLTNAAIMFATGGAGVSAGSTEYPPSTIWHTAAVRNDPSSGALALAANNLALLTGNLGRQGGGVLVLKSRANAQGSIDVGCHPGMLPGGLDVTDPTARSLFAELWSPRWNPAATALNGFKAIRDLPAEPGVSLTGIASAIEKGEITAMYVSAQSHKWADAIDPSVVAALEKLDFLVVEDCLASELTRIAHVVLPAAMYLEKDGSFTNLDRTVQRVRMAVSPPGDAQTTSWFLSEIASRLGYDLGVYPSSNVMDEIASVVDGYSGVSFPRLERGGMQWPVSDFGASQTVFLSIGHGLAPDRVQIVAD